MVHKIVIICVWMVLCVGVVIGQDTCPALVEQALQSVDDNCNEMARNTACYAYNQVQATFLQDVTDDFFSHPSDVADLTYLDTIQTSALDEANDIWGIAMMSVQANVPDTVPGQAVIFMLMGDTQVHNAVSPDDAFVAPDSIDVITSVPSANIRLTPSDTGYVLGAVPIDTLFAADGLSTDSEWVRIVYENQPAWIYHSIISSESSLADLPIVSDANPTPMQAFYFSTGTGVSTCNEAPNSLMIQGPNTLEVQINANGVDITIGSTIILESRGDNQISITTLSGYADIANVRIPGGFTIDAQTDEQGTIQPNTFTGLRPMSDDKIEQFKSLEQINGEAINYSIQVLNREQINSVQRNLEDGQTLESIRNQCVDSGLSNEQCQTFVGSDIDQNIIIDRCVASGLSTSRCQESFGLINIQDPISDGCQQVGFSSVDSCRIAYDGEIDERIEICTALGHDSGQSCRNAFPEDSVDIIKSCVAKGFSSKAACDVGSGTVTTDDNTTNTSEDNTSSNSGNSSCAVAGCGSGVGFNGPGVGGG